MFSCPAGRIIGDRGGGIIEDAGSANMAGLFGPPEVFRAVMGDMGIMESWCIVVTSRGEGDGWD